MPSKYKKVFAGALASPCLPLIAFSLLFCMPANSAKTAQEATIKAPEPAVCKLFVSSEGASHQSKAKAHRRVFTSVDQVIGTYAEAVRKKLAPIFANAGVAYPPKSMTWICLKNEKVLLLFARNKSGMERQVLAYSIVGTSGSIGPKLKEGDRQVPEGFYRIPSLHPNVVAHMALDVNYPNEEDRRHAQTEHRKNLGRDILIHGSRWSTGCLAMGNGPIEEMFVIAHDCGIQNIRLIFAPCNLAITKPQIDYSKHPAWLPNLYERIEAELRRYPIDTVKAQPAESIEVTESKW